MDHNNITIHIQVIIFIYNMPCFEFVYASCLFYQSAMQLTTFLNPKIIIQIVYYVPVRYLHFFSIVHGLFTLTGLYIYTIILMHIYNIINVIQIIFYCSLIS